MTSVYLSLTPRQAQVYDFIVEHRRAKGYPPTRREIAEHIGVASSNRAEEIVRALERKGLITVAYGISRGINLVDGMAR